ncbi:hypothetical protein DPMN_164198 [Dreissena polymorpha]|uniref:Uncharacterized protein n=1 Tax=Dreissena polymorpha TaxID=45954 RepID=A0A9D4IVD1_DREPO|nr:hypothetical protein DPMN_164198 [Dreissena polymorpha]
MFSEINKEPLVIDITGSQGISPISLSNGSEIIDSWICLTATPKTLPTPSFSQQSTQPPSDPTIFTSSISESSWQVFCN